MKPYPIQLEISGPTALWTRPDTGSSPVSYVAPTFSAVKGIFESVLRWKSVNVRPTKVEICAPVQFHRYTTNYGGPLRASDAMNKGASFQFYTVQVWRKLITAVEEQLAALTKQVEALAPKARPKGLGPLTLGTLLAELCDWSRFKNRKQIGSYTGLCGGVSSSGQSHCDLSITKAGNARVRWSLIELAWRMVQFQPQSKAVQRWKHILLNPKAAARQRKRALVALARQLAVDLWRWQTGKVTPEQLGWVMV